MRESRRQTQPINYNMREDFFRDMDQKDDEMRQMQRKINKEQKVANKTNNFGKSAFVDKKSEDSEDLEAQMEQEAEEMMAYELNQKIIASQKPQKVEKENAYELESEDSESDVGVQRRQSRRLRQRHTVAKLRHQQMLEESSSSNSAESESDSDEDVAKIKRKD